MKNTLKTATFNYLIRILENIMTKVKKSNFIVKISW